MKKLLVLFVVLASCSHQHTFKPEPTVKTTCEQQEEAAEVYLFERFQKEAKASDTCEYFSVFYYVTPEDKKAAQFYACRPMPKVVAVDCSRDCDTGWSGCHIFHEDGYTKDVSYWKNAAVYKGRTYGER